MTTPRPVEDVFAVFDGLLDEVEAVLANVG